MRNDCERIVRAAIAAVQPEKAVRRALSGRSFGQGKVLVIAVGKAAWTMAHAALSCLPRVDGGAVITKYGHSCGALGALEIFEAGHPEPDENGFAATARVLALTEDLCAEDTVLFLLSGGGSALFEKPLIEEAELRAITHALLKRGADITALNTVRKHLSSVKGGRFALHCAPAKIICVALSDVLGDDPSVIASGPACVDRSTGAEAAEILHRYGVEVSDTAKAALARENVRALENSEMLVCGSVRELTAAVKKECEALGYESVVLTNELTGEAREAGEELAALARENQSTDRPLAFILGGETVVKVWGKGLGGRNQELALSAALGIAGLNDTCIFSFGSDGTDGPTDAAGGFVDGETAKKLGERLDEALRENDSYHALQSVGGLIVTGPTGTNVNDAAILLIKR